MTSSVSILWSWNWDTPNRNHLLNASTFVLIARVPICSLWNPAPSAIHQTWRKNRFFTIFVAQTSRRSPVRHTTENCAAQNATISFGISAWITTGHPTSILVRNATTPSSTPKWRYTVLHARKHTVPLHYWKMMCIVMNIRPRDFWHSQAMKP